MQNKRLVAKMVLFSMSIALLPAQSSAVAKPKLSTKSIALTVGKTKTLKVKNTKKKARWSIKSGKKYIKLRAKKKASVKIYGVKKGTAKVQCKVGKKKLVCKVKVTKKTTPKNDIPVIDAMPTATPKDSTQSGDVSNLPKESISPQMTMEPTPEPTPTDYTAYVVEPLRTPGPTAEYDRLMMETSVCKQYVNPEFWGYETIDHQFFGTGILRNDIEQIIISDVNEVPANVLGVLDLSEKQNESVRAWYVDEDGNGKYEMTIAQDGGVVANENSICLFAGIEGDSKKAPDYETIVGLENLDISRVTNMTSMFSNMYIPSGIIDFGDFFDASHVTESSEMFSGTNYSNLRCYTTNSDMYKWLRENAEENCWRVAPLYAWDYCPENSAYIICGSPDEESQPEHIATENRLMIEPQLTLREDGTVGKIENCYKPGRLYFFGSDILREDIEFLTIADHIQTSEAAIETMDISEKQNGSVVAWYVDNDQDGKVEMTIGQEGGVVANEDSSYLFYGIGANAATDDSEGRLFDGFDHFYGADIASAFFMFAYCGDSTGSFKKLDLGKFYIESSYFDCDRMFTQCGNYEKMKYYMNSSLIYRIYCNEGGVAWGDEIPDINNCISIG